MDVARAADPAAVEAARERLAAIASRASAAPGFSVEAAPRARTVQQADGAEAFQRFEAFVLQSFLEAMMPEETDSVYGAGLAGGMWKSMMAEQLGAQMARAGGIGIADRILSDYYMRGEERVALEGSLVDPAGRRAAETRNLSSQALIHEIQRRVGQSLEGAEPGPAAGSRI